MGAIISLELYVDPSIQVHDSYLLWEWNALKRKEYRFNKVKIKDVKESLRLCMQKQKGV